MCVVTSGFNCVGITFSASIATAHTRPAIICPQNFQLTWSDGVKPGWRRKVMAGRGGEEESHHQLTQGAQKFWLERQHEVVASRRRPRLEALHRRHAQVVRCKVRGGGRKSRENALVPSEQTM